MSPLRTFPIVLAFACAVAACGPTDRPSPGFGEAVRHNMAMQVIDPDPHPGETAAPGMDGRRTGDAIGRYRDGKVKPPVSLGTTSLSRGGGGK